MTEPLLLGLTTLAIALLLRAEAALNEAGRRLDRWAGWTFALACLTRYEAWAVTACALAAALWVRWLSGASWQDGLRHLAPVAVPPVAAILAFLLFSRIVIGDWFAGGFFVPENPALGDPVVSLSQVIWGVGTLSGDVLTIVAAVGLGWLLVRAVADKRCAFTVIALSLLATAALPWLAFLQGHPYRIRYMVPLLAAEAVGAGMIVSVLLERSRALGRLGAAILVALAASDLLLPNGQAAMLSEAQWDRPNVSVAVK